jgi:acetoin utilization deacetylase AcuC-like enzyme
VHERQRHELGQAAGALLQVAQMQQMRRPLPRVLDVPEHDGGGGAQPDLMGSADHVEPFARVEKECIDCDVHQGNGTAAIFAGTRTASALLPSSSTSTVEQPQGAPRGKMRGAHAGDVFTISLHQHNNYPLHKPPSSIDVDLPDGTGDDDYLAWLDNALSSGLRQFEPDLLCYVAGADPYREDQLGGLNLTIDGLKKRDALVFRVARARNIPIMVTYAGGYAQNVEDTVTIHTNTVIAAKEAYS